MGSLVVFDCLDGDDRAARCRTVLDISRDRAAQLGLEAVAVAQAGGYADSAGRWVDLDDAIAAARAATRSLPPDLDLPAHAAERRNVTRVQVANETSLSAARRLTDGGHRVLVLNLANGIHPGGGFLGGSRAQEESLCRSSTLHATLVGDPMYAAHRRRSVPDSTAWAILSPDVPVFRGDTGAPLDEPWTTSFLTCAAPVARRVGQPLAGDLLAARIRRVLAISSAFGYEALVLGAWGCGAFGNDPVRTAADFRDALTRTAGQFAEVVFAIADWSPDRRFLGPFRDAFAAKS